MTEITCGMTATPEQKLRLNLLYLPPHSVSEDVWGRPRTEVKQQI